MGITFNVKEILEIAVEIEKNGQAFYRRGSQIVREDDAQAMLIKLAEWEAVHESIFANMLASLGGKDTALQILDPNGEAVKYLQAIADGKIFKTGVPVEQVIPDGATMCDVLWDALEREKDTVVFYVAFKAIVPPGDDRENLERIILEEVGHVRYISEELERRSCRTR